MKSETALKNYYYATPIFILLEWIIGANFRLYLPWDNDFLVYLYLTVCFIVGGYLLKKPSHISTFALVECSLNIILLSYTALTGSLFVALNEATGKNEFSFFGVINYVIVTSVFLYSFYTNPIVKSAEKYNWD